MTGGERVKKIKFRHEFKHYINLTECVVLQSKLHTVMKHDDHVGPNGIYLIRSLYFDTPDDKALMEKITGLKRHEKFRIRLYNHNETYIKLEKKVKTGDIASKRGASITKEQCEKILAGNIEWLKDSEKPLLKELYEKMQHQQLRPKTIVDYIREPYVFSAGNVRVTLDKQLKTGLYSIDLFNKELLTVDVLDPNLIILEVKYDAFLPEVISDILQLGDRRKTSISKYAICRKYE
jgi:hypothetical protein